MEGRHLLKKDRTVVAVQSLLGHSSYSNGKMWASGEEVENMYWQLDLLFSALMYLY